MEPLKIIVLGTEGTGKTLFLASMYRQLSVQNNDIGFYLQVPVEQHIQLSNIYQEVADPEHGWPVGTPRTISQWDFQCVIDKEGKKYYPLQFSYYDYAGGVLTDTPQPGDQVLQEMAQHFENMNEIDVFLVLIDGQKILQAIRGDKIPFRKDLAFLLPIIQHFSHSVHFVLTKWDILENNNITFNEVRTLLLQEEQFSAIVYRQIERGLPTRLIPVSSVGRNFAILENGVMKKKKNGELQPLFVEYPIACTLLDGFQVARDRLDSQSIKLLTKEYGLWGKLMGKLFGGVQIAIEVIPLPPQYNFPKTILASLLAILDEHIDYEIESLEQIKEEAFLNIKDEKSAILSIIDSFRYLMFKLEKEFPGSRLDQI